MWGCCGWTDRSGTYRVQCGAAVVGLTEVVHIGCSVGLLWLD